ncbi:nuclear transport factor 2 family protein [Actinomadura xylanilytica]|uniref:nuclear transport factor 2 family protein n=1 Tax=Actinomadura xylanilytica TaxID=887459 RepID=UPI00255B1955|nr:nuclear transport factor 2 family protein [Actinomadura xylanilytica]MDL4773266.1 nuclear transport factor 2 family protein [Actinomadura xylanilytica]
MAVDGDAADAERLGDLLHDAFNAHDHAAEGVFTPDFHSHPLGTTGPEAVTRAWTALHTVHPGARVLVEDLLVDDDRAAVRTSVHGTGTPEPPTILEIVHTRDGRVAEVWGLTDLTSRTPPR